MKPILVRSTWATQAELTSCQIRTPDTGTTHCQRAGRHNHWHDPYPRIVDPRIVDESGVNAAGQTSAVHTLHIPGRSRVRRRHPTPRWVSPRSAQSSIDRPRTGKRFTQWT